MDGYELAALLELRRQEQEDAQDAYAREVQELGRRETFVEAKRVELAEGVARRKHACAEHDARLGGGEVTMSQVRLFDEFVAGLEHDEVQLEQSIERAERAVKQQKVEVGRAKGDLIEATRELEAVEKHRETWEKEQATKAQRKRSAAMDEVAARRWMERNK